MRTSSEANADTAHGGQEASRAYAYLSANPLRQHLDRELRVLLRHPMKHYVGLDVSLTQTAVGVVDQAGKIKREGMVASNPEVIAEFISAHHPRRHPKQKATALDAVAIVGRIIAGQRMRW